MPKSGQPNPPQKEEITYRKLKNINSKQLSRDIAETLPRTKTGSVSQLVDYYNTSMKSLLEKHAPEKMKIIRQSHNQPWFNDTIKSEIVLRRKKEHTYFTDPTHCNFQAFYNQRRYVANLIKTAFNDYFISKITTIMDNLRPQDPIDTDQSLLEDHYLTDKRFGDFEVLDEEKVLQLIKDTPTKTCALDPLPTALVKNQSEVLSPYLTKIINISRC